MQLVSNSNNELMDIMNIEEIEIHLEIFKKELCVSKQDLNAV